MRLALGLPLTWKELAEQAARRRTYVLRVLVGLAFAFFGFVTLWKWQHDDQQLLGQGMRIFEVLANLLAWLPVVVAPAITAGAIAAEREEGSLPLLQMTRLGPAAIVLEKWLSRLLLILGLQLLALPLLALAYACGGVPEATLWWTIAGAMAAAVYATAVALLASAWCAGTVGAMFTAYGLLLACYLGTVLVRSWPEPWLHCLAPALGVTWLMEQRWRWSGSDPAPVLHQLIVLSLIPTGGAILAAIATLAWRRHRQGGNRLLALFRRLDAFFEERERRVLGRAARRELPRERPVAWRETSRRALVNPRYLARILVPLGALVVFGLVLGYGFGFHQGNEVAAWAGMLLEIGLGLLVLVLGATAFTAERSAQTLEVLLTTPLSPREILAQKLSGLRRVHLGGAILVGLVLLVRLLVNSEGGLSWRGRWSPWLALLSLAAMPVALGWLGLLVGLHVRQRARAVGAAVGLAVAWTVAGVLAVWVLDVSSGLSDEECWLAASSPAILGVANHQRGFNASDHVKAAVLFAVGIGLAIIILRTWALARVGALLRRG